MVTEARIRRWASTPQRKLLLRIARELQAYEDRGGTDPYLIRLKSDVSVFIHDQVREQTRHDG